MKAHFIYLVCFVLFFMVSCSSLKTTPETIKEITRKVEAKDFTVSVNYANPMRMKSVYLTSEYDLRIKNDSVFAFLPYYGVAHVAPMNPGEGGIKFAEPVAGYTITPNKKSNGWDIRFRVKARESVYDINMTVFNNGSAMFTVNPYDRDAITFNGEIKR